MDESADGLQDKMPESLEETKIRVLDSTSGELIDEFSGKNPPIPEDGDILRTAWMDTEDGETDADVYGPYRVVDRIYTYTDRQNYDTEESGLVTLVELLVIPN